MERQPLISFFTVTYYNYDRIKMEMNFGLYSYLFFEKQKLGHAVWRSLLIYDPN